MAVAVDASSPAIATNSTSANLTCASFNPPACLLVACLGGDGGGNMTPAITNNGTALTWTNRGERDPGDGGAQSGIAAIFTAELTAGRTGMTVTLQITGTGAGGKALKVYCVTGYDSADPIGNAPGEGSSTTNAITPTIISAVESANSRIFVAANEWNQLGSPTSSDLTIDAFNIASVDAGFFGHKAGPGSAGSSVTGNMDAAGSGAAAWNWVAIEVEPTASGTTFTQNVSGGITPAGALVRQTGKPLAGGITPAGSLLRTCGKTLAGSITPAGSLLKQTAKTLAGSIAPTGVLTAIKTALLAFSGSITPTGTLVRRDQKPLAGSCAPSGSLVKQDQKTFAGSLTPSGALAVLKAALRTFTGSLTPAGTLVRQDQKATAGSITPAGVLARQDQKRFTGGITPTGALAATKAVLRSFAGSIAPSGVLVRQVGKALAGALTPTATVVKLAGRTFAGTLAAAGAVAKQAAKRFTGTAVPAGTVTTQPIVGGAFRVATSTPTATARRASTATVTARRTSAPLVTATQTSSPTVAGGE